jgi:DNA polymerase III epsilon subunit-like protein
MKDTFPYPGKFTFVDVEIPNLNNNCVCAVSMIVVEDHQVVLRHTELINPKTYFSSNNIKIHGIKPASVRKARSFNQFWKEFSVYFSDPYIVGAHNALSDLSVINKDLMRSGKALESKYYIDTMDIAAGTYFKEGHEKGQMKLSNLAEKLEIPIEHHNPESDVNACYEIVKKVYDDFRLDLHDYIKEVPPLKVVLPKHTKRPSKEKMIEYRLDVRRRLSRKDPALQMSSATAVKQGDRAYANLKYRDMVLFYETAISRKTQVSGVYLRLSDLYFQSDLPQEGFRILDQGIALLKQNDKSYLPLRKAKLLQTRYLKKKDTESKGAGFTAAGIPKEKKNKKSPD